MTTASPRPVFEQISDRHFTSEGIRPGGLDLTRRGRALAKLKAGCRVLDIGCGTGVTVGHLVRENKIQAVGIDLSSALVAQGRARDPALPLAVGEAEALPYADESFDGVFLECTLSLVKEHAPVFSECHRVLKPLGVIILTDLYARRPTAIDKLRSLSVHSCLKGAVDKDRLVHECMVAGFETVCWEDQSVVLRQFAVNIIWTYGSLHQFWNEVGGGCADLVEIHRAIRESRPGYFLYVGVKV